MSDYLKRLDDLDEDVAFLARMMILMGEGHATESEYERLYAIMERDDRYPKRGRKSNDSNRRDK